MKPKVVVCPHCGATPPEEVGTPNKKWRWMEQHLLTHLPPKPANEYEGIAERYLKIDRTYSDDTSECVTCGAIVWRRKLHHEWHLKHGE
jgi:hypothetical protein